MLLSQQRRLCNPGALIELLLHACSTQGNAAAYLSPLLGWLGLYQLLGSSYPSEGGWPAPRSHCLKNGVCTSIFAPTHCQLYKPTGPCDVHYFLPLGWVKNTSTWDIRIPQTVVDLLCVPSASDNGGVPAT